MCPYVHLCACYISQSSVCASVAQVAPWSVTPSLEYCMLRRDFCDSNMWTYRPYSRMLHHAIASVAITLEEFLAGPIIGPMEYRQRQVVARQAAALVQQQQEASGADDDSSSDTSSSSNTSRSSSNVTMLWFTGLNLSAVEPVGPTSRFPVPAFRPVQVAFAKVTSHAHSLPWLSLAPTGLIMAQKIRQQLEE